MLYPKNIEEKIGFTKVRELIKTQCLSTLAAEIVDEMKLSIHLQDIQPAVESIHEMCKLLNEQTATPPINTVADLREAFVRTRIEGTYLTTEDLVMVRNNMQMATAVSDFMGRLEERYIHLKKLTIEHSDFRLPLREINTLIDKFGTIKDTASPELADIRRQIISAQSSISRTLQRILKQAQSEGLVEDDASPTLRDGRLVLPVISMNKRKLGGIVHDESATGKTVFIEPSEVVEINNRIRELKGEEQREIIRLLVHTTNTLRPLYAELLDLTRYLAHIDAMMAKAKFANKINATAPQFVGEKPHIQWIEARHPLLQISLEEQDRAIVPLNIELNKKNRILLISGPNAGGKSVCLKTVGLLQYMLQCGLPIPVSDESKAGIFHSIFIDMGDEQSIENDLSTYSSHLLNMRQMLRFATQRSLLLIDEFGTGTEPQIGGAIAEAILEKFHEIGTFGVITTHYSNLKHFATETDGIANGAMLYDRSQMQPLFSLQIGTPGSSFAIEMAKRIGMPNEVIQRATEKVGTELVDYDKSLQDAIRDKQYWQRKREEVKNLERELKEKKEQLDENLQQIKQIRHDTIQKAKEDAGELLRKANATIERTIKDIRESQANPETTRVARENVAKLKQTLHTPTQQPQVTKNSEPIEVGDKVQVHGKEVVGEVIKISGKSAVIAFGDIKSTINLNKLTRVSKAEVKRLQIKTSNAVDVVRNKQLEFKQQIDVRGMRVDEALNSVSYYIDDAISVGVQVVRILHGTGTGALRQAIREYLGSVRAVVKYHDEHVQFGGAGITVVWFRES